MGRVESPADAINNEAEDGSSNFWKLMDFQAFDSIFTCFHHSWWLAVNKWQPADTERAEMETVNCNWVEWIESND